MINWRTLGFGSTFGTIDAIALPLIKSVSKGWSLWWMAVPVLLYGVTPFLFLKALEKETLTIMNMAWDLSSDLIVTVIGLSVFAEQISPTKLLGVLFSFIGLFLMTYEGDGWNDFLTRNYRAAVANFK